MFYVTKYVFVIVLDFHSHIFVILLDKFDIVFI